MQVTVALMPINIIVPYAVFSQCYCRALLFTNITVMWYYISTVMCAYYNHKRFCVCDVGSKHVLLPINSTVSCAVTDQQYYVMCCYRSTVLSCAVTDQQYCVMCCYRSTVLRHVLLPINSVASCAVTNQYALYQSTVVCCVIFVGEKNTKTFKLKKQQLKTLKKTN